MPLDAAEHTLVAKLRAGDELAFREIWDQYHIAIAEFAYRYLNDTDAAEDIVQHVFVTLWQQRDTLDPKGTLASYLYTTARHRIWNILKHDRIARSYREREAARQNAQPKVPYAAGSDTTQSDLAHRVRLAVQGLTPRVREIFLMSRMDGLSAAQIARILGVSQQVVYNQLSKALRHIARTLERDNM